MNYQFDALIIGSGIAGLSAALKLTEAGFNVGLVTREEDPNVTNTCMAQGGIIFSKENDKDIETDIKKASSNTSNLAAITCLRENSGRVIQEVLIEKVKVDFAKDENGNLLLTREAAHSIPRILFKGDYTGKEIQTSFLNYLKDSNRFPNLNILASHTAIDLLTPRHHGVSLSQRYEEDKVIGAYLFDQKLKKVKKAISKVTILATGGLGALYLHHTNSEGARGDGHAMAARAGAILTDMEFIQFHPTTFFEQHSHRRFLISEAVRGEGGILLNNQGTPFMANYHPDKELAPRDVVAQSIMEEMIRTNRDCVYLDISHKESSWIKKRFPTIYDYCLQRKIDITKEPIPVIPAAHYTCGGVKTDLNGKTNLKNLYAVGEVACTGLHGANRLASTSLLEGLTFGYLAATEISINLSQTALYPEDLIKNWEESSSECDHTLINQDLLTLKQTMWNYVGLTRNTSRLKRAQAMFFELSQEIDKFYKNASLDDSLIGLRNAVEVALIVQKASLLNKNSIGCFIRKD